MALKRIQFGTNGWRGVIADDFTFEGVRAATAAIADYVTANHPSGAALILGFDPRFLSDAFAREAAGVLTARGIHCFLCRRPTPTPVISHEIRRRKTAGAINFTASHNPPEYNGLKFSIGNGAAALKAITQQLEKTVATYLDGRIPAHAEPDPARLEPIDPVPAYLETLSKLIDLDAIRAAGIRIGFDALHGASVGCLDRFLEEQQIPHFSMHTERDALFGGHAPEPGEENLREFGRRVRSEGAALGVSCDGDADRFGIVDCDGSFISPNHILGLLADYLLESRPDWPRAVARSVATSHLLDAVAKHHGAEVCQTPVGFKYIAEMILADQITLGGEESAGLSIFRHLPEKDGILAGMLVAEMTARRGASLGDQLRALFGKVGGHFPIRVNLKLDAATQQQALERIQTDPATLGPHKVEQVDRTDGLKLMLAGGAWVMMRPSGTEPVVRIYCEAPSAEQTQALARTAQRFLLE